MTISPHRCKKHKNICFTFAHKLLGNINKSSCENILKVLRKDNIFAKP